MIQKLALILLIILFPLNSKANSFEEHLKKGDFHYKNFQNQLALIEYEKAYKINKDEFEIIKKLVLTYNDCGEDLRDTNIKSAKEYFKKSVSFAKLAKDNFSEEHFTHFLLAISYGNLARYTSGKEKVKIARNVERNLKAMIEHEPNFAPSYIALGIYYREVSKLSWLMKIFAKTIMGGLPDGTLEDSKSMLLKAIELDPNFITSHYEIAKTYRYLKDTEAAVYHYNKVLELPVKDHQDKTKKNKAAHKLIKLSP